MMQTFWYCTSGIVVDKNITRHFNCILQDTVGFAINVHFSVFTVSVFFSLLEYPGLLTLDFEMTAGIL